MILNLLLIPSYRNNGAAIASVVSEIIVTFITFRCSKKYFKLHVKKKLIMNILIGTLLMTIILYCINYMIKIIWVKVIADLIIGFLSYIIYMSLSKGWKGIIIFQE